MFALCKAVHSKSKHLLSPCRICHFSDSGAFGWIAAILSCGVANSSQIESLRTDEVGALQTKAKPVAEVDAFFLDSEDDQSSEEVAATSGEPAAEPCSKRGRAEVSANQAQTGIAQQAHKGRAQQGQKSMAQQAKNGMAPQAGGATGSVAINSQPSAKRRALASPAQNKKAAAKSVRSSSTADASGVESALAQPMSCLTSSARSNKKLDQPAREDSSPRPQYTARSIAVSVADKVILSRVISISFLVGKCACNLLLCL